MIYPIERRKRRTRRKIEPTEDRVNLIIEYYNQDISYKEMCQLTGYSVPTIKKIIEQRRKMNQNNEDENLIFPKDDSERDRTPKNKITEEQKDKICECYNKNYTYKEISEATHISVTTILKVIKERRALAIPKRIKEDDFVDYFFKVDTRRLYSIKDVKKFYSKCVEEKNEDWQQYIDKILEEK